MGIQKQNRPASSESLVLFCLMQPCRADVWSALVPFFSCDTLLFLKVVFTGTRCSWRGVKGKTQFMFFGKESPKISAYEIYECLHESLHIEEGEIEDIQRQVLTKFITGQQAAFFLHRTNGCAFYENRNVKSLASASVPQASYTAYILITVLRPPPSLPPPLRWLTCPLGRSL